MRVEIRVEHDENRPSCITQSLLAQIYRNQVEFLSLSTYSVKFYNSRNSTKNQCIPSNNGFSDSRNIF